MSMMGLMLTVLVRHQAYFTSDPPRDKVPAKQLVTLVTNNTRLRRNAGQILTLKSDGRRAVVFWTHVRTRRPRTHNEYDND